MSKLRHWLRLGVSFLLVTIMLFVSVHAAAYSSEDYNAIAGNTVYFKPDAEGCSQTAGINASTNVAVNEVEATNAKIVMGIAKTDGLDQKGALIGLMVAITESHLQNYANSTVPLSLTLPHDAVGSDHDSVGIFQQRPSTGWSTIATGQDALNSLDAIKQVMTPAYAAEAFFGSPPGSNAPPALSKGLVNVSNWQALDPWVAAQKVQASGTPDGSNYKAKMAQAQSLIDQFWANSAPVPLPVALTGGTGSSSSSSSNSCSQTGVSGSLFQTIVKYAWPDYHAAPYVTMKPEYKAAIDAAHAKGEYIGGSAYPGVDCGGFVTRVMRDSGADPHYNAYNGNTIKQKQYMDDNPTKYQQLSNVAGTADLKPGDIAINSTHTYIYVGSIPGFNGNSASASQDERAPMASAAYDFGSFTWYRPIGPAQGATP